jgi:hypothetical protein
LPIFIIWPNFFSTFQLRQKFLFSNILILDIGFTSNPKVF